MEDEKARSVSLTGLEIGLSTKDEEKQIIHIIVFSPQIIKWGLQLRPGENQTFWRVRVSGVG